MTVAVGAQRRLRRLRRAAPRVRRSRRSSASTTTTIPAPRWTTSARRSTQCAAARSRPRTATTATTSPSSRRSTATPCRVMLGLIEAALKRFRIRFDTFERQSVVEAEIPEAIALLDTYEDDGALWARTSAHGDEKDRVLGAPTGRRPTSRPMPPTCAGSTRRASTTSSTSSAPITTATSAACRRWPRCSVTRVSRSRC